MPSLVVSLVTLLSMPNTVFSSSVSGSNCSVLFKIFILTCGFDFVLSSENAIYFLSDSCNRVADKIFDIFLLKLPLLK